MAPTELFRNAKTRTAWDIPARSIMAGVKQQPLKTLQPRQYITVVGLKAGQAQQEKTARISRAAI